MFDDVILLLIKVRYGTDDVFSIGIGFKRAGFVGPIRYFWTLGSSTKTRNKKDRRGSLSFPQMAPNR